MKHNKWLLLPVLVCLTGCQTNQEPATPEENLADSIAVESAVVESVYNPHDSVDSDVYSRTSYLICTMTFTNESELPIDTLRITYNIENGDGETVLYEEREDLFHYFDDQEFVLPGRKGTVTWKVSPEREPDLLFTTSETYSIASLKVKTATAFAETIYSTLNGAIAIDNLTLNPTASANTVRVTFDASWDQELVFEVVYAELTIDEITGYVVDGEDLQQGSNLMYFCFEEEIASLEDVNAELIFVGLEPDSILVQDVVGKVFLGIVIGIVAIGSLFLIGFLIFVIVYFATRKKKEA